jgi:predicted outer membrane protein
MKPLTLGIILTMLFAFVISCRNNNNDTGPKNIGDTATAGRDAAQVSTRDEDFVADVYENNEIGRFWLKRAANFGTDPELKSQASQMLTDHEKMESELRNYANNNNITLSAIDTGDDVDMVERVGKEWDEECADEMGDLYRRMVNRFERAEDRVKDTALQSMISSNLPVLRNHLVKSRSIEERLDKARR